MSDLKALRREMALSAMSQIDMMLEPSKIVAIVAASLLRYAQACLRAEASEGMIIAGQAQIPPLPHYKEYRQQTGNQDQPWCYAVKCNQAMNEKRCMELENE